MPSRPISRRRFLAASAATVAAAPFVRAVAPGESRDKVRLAVVGVANRGAENLKGVATEEIVALCDVDPANAGKAREQFPSAQFFTDWRKMLDAVVNKVDGVVVSTPDHSHAGPAVRALKLGKPVYCEKPLARTVQEVRAIRQAAEAAKVPTQMGTQIHAGENYRRVVEIVRSGALGPVRAVHVWFAGKPPAGRKVKAEARPGLDLDLWRGPVADEWFGAEHPGSGFNHPWPHFHWRYWWQYGGGTLGDFGCHYLDLPFWALGLGLPATVKAAGTPIPNADNAVPQAMTVEYAFPAAGDRPAVALTWEHGVTGPDLGGERAKFDKFPSGVLFVGDKGKLVADYSKLRVLPDGFAKGFKAPAASIPKSVGHHREWLDAVRGTGTPLCHFGYGGVVAETVLLGNVAYRTEPGRALEYDAAAGKFAGAPAADQYLGQPTRKGWELG